MIIPEKEKKRINELVVMVREYIVTYKVIELDDKPKLRDMMTELYSLILKALGKARITAPSHRQDITTIENFITNRFTGFSQYHILSRGLEDSISHWVGRIVEALSIVEAIEATLNLVSRAEYDKALETIKTLKEKNAELENLIVSISIKADSLVFNLPDLKALVQRISISKVVQEEVKNAIQAYRNRDFKGALRAIGVAGEQLTQELFVRLFGESEAKTIKKWESRLMKIHSHVKDKDQNLHILIADLLLAIKWLRHRADHPLGYTPNEDDVRVALIACDLVLRKYESILSG